MTNQEVANRLFEIGDLLSLEGGEKFKILAYQKAAKAISSYEVDINKISNFQSIPGVGSSIAQKVGSIIKTGSCPQLDELREKNKDLISTLELTKVRGIGVQTALKFHKEGVTSLEQFADLVLNHGKYPEYKERVEFAINESKSGCPISKASLTVECIIRELKKVTGVLEAIAVGSYRRRKTFVNDLDILVKCNSNSLEVHKIFSSLGKVLASGAQKTSIIFESQPPIQVDLLTVPSGEFGSALNYFTGSKEHNIALRNLAKSRGMLVNEHGIFSESGDKLGGGNEEDLYTLLGLPFCPPELRENGLVLEIPELLDMKDLIYDYHSHTHFSGDCSTPLVELVNASRKFGIQRLGISDHIAKAAYGNKLNIQTILERDSQIRMLSSQEFKILSSAEVDINTNGELTAPPELLERLDYIVGSTHVSYSQNVEERIKKAVNDNPKIKLIAHPTGRSIGYRPEASVNWDSLLSFLAQKNVGVEINSQPSRLDFDPDLVRLSIKYGCKVSISSDAHSPEDYGNMKFGLWIARRAGVSKKDLLVL